MKFNEAQQRAIDFKEGMAMLVAGAGSGKTTVLVNRIKSLVEGGRRNITAITFTRKSAEDLERKLKELKVHEYVNVGTFHVICGRIMQKCGLYSKGDIKSYEIENMFNEIYGDSTMVDVEDVLSFISIQKGYMRGCEDEFVYSDTEYSHDMLRKFYRAYEEYKKARGIYDLDDILLEGYRLLGEYPELACDYLLCDEHQDANLIQNELINRLCPSGNVMVVGDFKQSIYGFRGAVPSMFMDFDKRYSNVEVIKLDYNYRSRKEIVENANLFIQNYYKDYEHYSDSIPASQERADIDFEAFLNAEEEAEEVGRRIRHAIEVQGIEPEDIAVLYRNNTQSFHIENELRVLGIEYDIEKNGSFFQRKEISIILAMLRLAVDNSDNVAFQTIVKSRIHYFKLFKKDFMQQVIDVAKENNVSYLVACQLMKLPQWQRNSIFKFVELIDTLTRNYKYNAPLELTINNIINAVRLEEYLNDRYTGEELEERLMSVETLKDFIRDNTVDSFLDYIYKPDDKKRRKKKKQNKVQLMTLHKSKGLEFKQVYMIGLKDGKFPSKDTDICEEARLFYVGITRSIDTLFLGQLGVSNTFVRQYLEM